MVELLELLGYCTEVAGRLLSSSLGLTIRRLESSLCHQAENGYCFESGKHKAAKGEGSVPSSI